MKRIHPMNPALRMAALWIVMLLPAGVILAHAQPAAPAACQELLANGDFEAGPAGWTQSSGGGYQLISRFNPRSGQWGAYLAGANDADDQLSQVLLLPSNAVSITLHLWWSAESEEPPVPADRLSAALLLPNGALLAELWTVDNTAATGIWDELVVDLAPWVGQQVTLQFQASADSFDLTDFYLDDIGVRACAAAPTPTASPTSTASPTPTGPPRRIMLPLIVHHR
jgi:hypothetical protein